jgi:hypothetical protein
LELAEEVFGYVEDEEPEPLTEWYKARCQRQRTEIMEYDITTIVANILIGLGLGIGLVVFWVWRTVRRFEDDLRGLVRETIREVEADMVGIVVEEDARTTVFLS